MRKLVPVLLIIAAGALAAAGRIAVWLDVPGSADYLLVEGARAGFEEGLTDAGLNVAPRDEVTSINTVIDPSSDAQLAQLAAALGCDYAAALTVTASPVARYYNAINDLPPGSTILVSMDLDPSTLPELEPMLKATVRQALDHGLKVISITLVPDAPSIAERIMLQVTDELNAKYEATGDERRITMGEDWVYLGFRAGGDAVIFQLGKEIRTAYPSDYYGIPLDDLPMMTDVHSLDDMGLVMTVSGTSNLPEDWISYAGAPFGIPVLVGCTAVYAPAYYDYLQTRRIAGMLGGLKGAEEYEKMISQPADAARGVVISGLVFDPYAGKRYESPVALAQSADGARETAARLAGELAENLPTSGPVISLDARWSTAQAALGAGDGLEPNDYLWVYRYGEPLVHPDTGEILGVAVIVVGAGRVEEVRGDHLSLVSLSPPAEGLEYSPTDRVRALDEGTYAGLGFARGTVVSFGILGFGGAATLPVPLPVPVHPPGPEGVELKLEESLELDYSPVGLDASSSGVVLCDDDGRLHLLPPRLESGPERVVETGVSGPVARLGDEVYLADSWEGVVLRLAAGSDAPEAFAEGISPELLVAGGDGSLWAVVFSYSSGWDLVTYPALELGPAGDVVEVRDLDAGKLDALAASPDGTLYYLVSFEPIRGLRSDGSVFEVGARMLPDPKALDTDSLGWLYAVDARSGLVVFDARQRVAGTWGGAGVVDFRNINLIAVTDDAVYLASGWDRILYRLSLAYTYPER